VHEQGTARQEAPVALVALEHGARMGRRLVDFQSFDIGELEFANAAREDGRFARVRASVDIEGAPLVILHGAKVALDDLIVHAVLGCIRVFASRVLGVLFLGS